jgi:hypothetical protein
LSFITRLRVTVAAALLALPAAQALQPQAQAPQAQEPQTQIRASVDVVRLSVAVVHTSGGVIPPLSVDDFAVWDNGVRQEVRLLRRPEETPLRVALLVDASPSVRPWWPMVVRAAVSFLAKLPPDACPYVLPFAEGIGPGRWGRYPAASWRAFLADAPRGAGTSLYDALVIALQQLDLEEEMAEAVDKLAEEVRAAEEARRASIRPSPVVAEPGGMDAAAIMRSRPGMMAALQAVVARIVRDSPYAHVGNCEPPTSEETAAGGSAGQRAVDASVKAVVLLSDGADYGSHADAEDVINAARLASVPVFPVALGNASRDRGLAALLDELAGATGGLVTEDVEVNELGMAYDRVLGLVRATYVLVYEPDELSPEEAAGVTERSWHEIKVELSRPLLRAIARPGYYR